MAFAKLYFNPNSQYGGQLRGGLNQLESGLRIVIDMRDALTLMIDGDGSSSTQFSEATSRFGFADNATAKAAWDEMNSYLGKEMTDGSVTFVNAAREQLFDKLR